MNAAEPRRGGDTWARVGRVFVSGIVTALFGTALAVLHPRIAHAQGASGPWGSDVAQRLNPFADSILIPATLSAGTGGESSGITAISVELEPRIPFRLHRHWRLVSLWDVSLTHVPGTKKTTAWADVDASLFLTRLRTGKWVWGAGPTIQMPMATSAAFGTGKWSGGPTAALFFVQGRWTNGVLVRYLESFSGSSNRPDVRVAQLRWQVACDLSNGWYVMTDPTDSYDTRGSGGDRWTVPMGMDIGRNLAIGSETLSLQIGGYYFVVRPTAAAAWQISAQLAWLH